MNYKEKILADYKERLSVHAFEDELIIGLVFILEQILSTLPSEKEMAKRVWGEWVDYMNEHEPCPMGDHRIPPKLLDWLNKENK